MTTSPYAKLLVSKNGGAFASGGITATFSDVLRLRSEDTTVGAYRFEITGHPESFACPAGWSTASDGYTYYFAASGTPPDITLPSSHAAFGLWLFRLTVNNGDPGASGLPDSQFVDDATAVQIIGDSGVHQVGFGEGTQFSPRKYVAALQLLISLVDTGLGGGFGTPSIADHSVTHVKYQTIATHTLLGNSTGSTGNVQEVGVTNGLEFTSTNIGIAAKGVTYARIQDVTNTQRVLGRGTAGAGVVEELTVGGGIEFSSTALQRSALTGDVTASAGSGVTTIGANKVTLAMMATVATATFLGRTTAGAGNVEALTATQATALLNAFVASGASHAKGLVPDPGASAGTTKFLREDSTWQVPSAAAAAGSSGQIQWNNAGVFAGASAITTNGTWLGFGASPPTAGLINVEYNGGGTAAGTGVLVAKNSAGTAVSLLRFRVNSTTSVDDELSIGTTTGVTEIRNLVVTAGKYRWSFGTTEMLVMTGQGAAITTVASTGTVSSAWKVTDAAHTALTASTERTGVHYDLSSTKQFATGTLPVQRAARFQAPTYSFVGASALGLAATLAISGAPIAGTNNTQTSSAALLIESGGIAFANGDTLSTVDLPSGASGLLMVGKGAGASPKIILQGRVAAGGTSVNLLRWGTNGDNIFTVGENTSLATLALRALTLQEFSIGGNVEAELTATQLDLKNNNLVGVTQITGAFFGNEIDTGNSGTAKTIDFSAGPFQKSTCNNNVTYTFTAPAQHKCVQMYLVFSGGSHTITWPGTVKWQGGTQPSWDTSGAPNLVVFYWNGTNYLGIGATAFA